MPHARRLLLLLCCLTLAACGGEERAAEVEVLPPSSTASVPAPVTLAPEDPATATAPPLPAGAAAGTTGATRTDLANETLEEPAPNPGGASAEDAQTGGAGDTPDGASGTPMGTGEAPIAQLARFELGSVTLRPASVTVAPFLGVELVVVNVDGGFHRVELVGTDVAFEVQGGQTERRTLPGLKAGMYTVNVDGGKQASSLVVGDEAAG